MVDKCFVLQYDFNMKFLLPALILISFLAFPCLTYAQESTLQQKRQERLEAAKDRIQEKKETLMDKKAEVREARTEKRQAVKEEIEAKREAMKEKMAQKKDALKAKLDAFKDKKKAESASRISENLNKINRNRTDHFSKFLEKARAILTKLDDRVVKAKADGKNTTAAQAAIDKAKAALATAESAVTAQAGKDYTLAVTDETKVRSEAKGTRDGLHNDLQAVKRLVVDAKQAISEAIRVASTTLGGKEATKSGGVNE